MFSNGSDDIYQGEYDVVVVSDHGFRSNAERKVPPAATIPMAST